MTSKTHISKTSGSTLAQEILAFLDSHQTPKDGGKCCWLVVFHTFWGPEALPHCEKACLQKEVLVTPDLINSCPQRLHYYPLKLTSPVPNTPNKPWLEPKVNSVASLILTKTNFLKVFIKIDGPPRSTTNSYCFEFNCL